MKFVLVILFLVMASVFATAPATKAPELTTLQKVAREPWAKHLVPVKEKVSVKKIMKSVLPPKPPKNPLEFEYHWPPKPKQGPEAPKTSTEIEYFVVPDDRNSDQYVMPGKNVKPLTLKLKNAIDKRMHELHLRRFAAFDMRADDIDDLLTPKDL